jgi:hypothetical protein
MVCLMAVKAYALHAESMLNHLLSKLPVMAAVVLLLLLAVLGCSCGPRTSLKSSDLSLYVQPDMTTWLKKHVKAAAELRHRPVTFGRHVNRLYQHTA